MKAVASVVKTKQSVELGKAEKRTNFKRKNRYTTYIYKMSKQAHPEHGSPVESVWMNSSSLFDQIAAEAARLSLYNKRRTITSQEVQRALSRLLHRGCY
ncbi:histone H2B.3-like [Scyliorhinus canicula]|uniref:histone H2B.3-like n=1 Tax=Scyliorhinus canicula TaxID=7830 RepID=UPI0018F44798|nr:histone H2B.3-like [Scyliorhinus canicula]